MLSKNKKISCMAFLFVCMTMLVSMSIKTSETTAGKLPLIVIESYELTSGDFSPGTTSKVTLTVMNNGDSYAADTVKISFSSLDGVTPVYGTDNQMIIDELQPGEEAQVVFDVEVPANIEKEKLGMDFEISYVVFEKDSKNYLPFTNNASISVPVKYDKTFKVNSVSVAESTTVGATTLVSISYSNDSPSDVKEIELIIEGNIDPQNKKVKIGELSSGQTEYKDTYVKFLEEGHQNINICITYVDGEGRVISREVGNYSVEVGKTLNENSSGSVELEKDNTVYIVIFVIIVVLVMGALYIAIIRKKND